MQLLFSQPLLSTTSAHLISLLLGTTYVGSLYLSKKARLSFVSTPAAIPERNGNIPREKLKEERWRDDPDVIRARIFAVSVATVICCLVVFVVLWSQVGGNWKDFDIALDATLLRLGILTPSLSRFLHDIPSQVFSIRFYKAHLVTPVLFLGPLFGALLGGQLPGQRNWTWRTHVVARFFGIQGIRNFWTGPITEEIVFRACILSVYHLAGSSKTRMIFLGPLTFGLAHAHHAWDTYNRYGRNKAAAKRAIFMSLFQLSYTTLFGIHASYLFLRTGSLWPPITAHIFCNVMGIPEISYELENFRQWKWIILSTYLSGIVGFIYLLPRWTSTMGNFYWPVEGDEAFTYGNRYLQNGAPF